MRGAVLAVLLCFGVASTANAQTPAAKSDSNPLWLLSAQYGQPLRTVGDLAFCACRSDHTSSPLLAGWIVDAGAGQGGTRIAVGGARFLEYAGVDARLTLNRTSSSPRNATPRATYGGIEAGLTIYYVRFSVGVAHRLAGADGDHGTIVTWSGSLQIPIK